ncbi:hypothetical protein ACLOJK_008584 [Asimina triloba]
MSIDVGSEAMLKLIYERVYRGEIKPAAGSDSFQQQAKDDVAIPGNFGPVRKHPDDVAIPGNFGPARKHADDDFTEKIPSRLSCCPLIAPLF